MFLSRRSNGIYYLWFDADGGQRQKLSTGCKLKSDALKFLKDFKADEVRQKVEVHRKTLSTFFSEYLSYSRDVHTPKTQESIGNAFRELIRITGDIRLDSLGVRHIEEFLSRKRQEASVWTATKYYIHLASGLETAKRWNYIKENPFRKVQKPKPPEKIPVYFSKDAFRSLQSVTEDSDLRELSQLAVSTGMRLGEILNLQWTDIDLIRKVIRVGNREGFTTKSKKGRNIPMSDQLSELMQDRKARASSELVFHSGGKKLREEFVSKRFKQSVRKAGLDDKLHFHSLRHTFASWLVQDGVSLYEVQKLLGHSNITVTQVYSHLQPEKLHSTVNRINISVN